jgi:hypothetical protein
MNVFLHFVQFWEQDEKKDKTYRLKLPTSTSGEEGFGSSL